MYIGTEWAGGHWNTPGGPAALWCGRRTDAQQDTDEDTEPLHDTGEDTDAHQNWVPDTMSLDTRTPGTQWRGHNRRVWAHCIRLHLHLHDIHNAKNRRRTELTL